MNSRVLKSVLAVALTFASQSAFARFEITAVGGWDMFDVAQSTGRTSSAGNSFAAGGLLGIGMGPKLSLETGAIYAQNKVAVTDVAAGSAYALTMNQLQIPLVVRFAPVTFVSVGVGGYLGVGLGDVTQTGVIGAVPVAGSLSRAAANISSTDAGLTGVVGLRLPISRLRIGVDGRYLFGLMDLDKSSGSMKTREMQVLGTLGVAF